MDLMLDSNKSSLNDPFLDKEWMWCTTIERPPHWLPFQLLPRVWSGPDSRPDDANHHQTATSAINLCCTPALSLSLLLAGHEDLLLNTSSCPVWWPNKVYIYFCCQGAVSSSWRCPRHRTVTYVDVLTLCSQTNELLWEKGWLVIFHPLVRLYEILLDLFYRAVFVSDF